MGIGWGARRALHPDRTSWQAVLVFVQLTPWRWGLALGGACRPRRGRALMARLVKRALEEEQHVLVETGTGS